MTTAQEYSGLLAMVPIDDAIVNTTSIRDQARTNHMALANLGTLAVLMASEAALEVYEEMKEQGYQYVHLPDMSQGAQ